jgi:hypothetical protein
MKRNVPTNSHTFDTFTFTVYYASMHRMETVFVYVLLRTSTYSAVKQIVMTVNSVRSFSVCVSLTHCFDHQLCDCVVNALL